MEAPLRSVSNQLRAIGLAACVFSASVGLSGCASVGMSMLSAALGLGANHQINGVSTRTFTESQDKVEAAAIAALDRMGMKILAREETDSGRLLRASANDRSIDVDFEPLSTTTTRVSATTRRNSGIFLDGATSAEIIEQTMKSLELNRQADATAKLPGKSVPPTTSGGFAPTPSATAGSTPNASNTTKPAEKAPAKTAARTAPNSASFMR